MSIACQFIGNYAGPCHVANLQSRLSFYFCRCLILYLDQQTERFLVQQIQNYYKEGFYKNVEENEMMM